MSCGKTFLNPEVPCSELDGQYKKFFLIKEGFEFSTQADAKDKSNWQDGIQSGDIIPLPNLFSIESQDSGAAYDQSSLGDVTVSNGTVSWMSMIAANSELYTKIESFSGAIGYQLAIATASNKFKMFKTSDGTLAGFDIQLFNVENPTLNDGSVAEKAPIKITLEDPQQLRKAAVVFAPSFNSSRLSALADVYLEEVGTSTATEITFKASRYSANEDVQAANPQQGLVQTDLILRTAAGASQTIGGLSGGTAAENYVYTITGTGLVTGTLSLADPSLMTTKGLSGVNDAPITIA